MAFKIKIKFFYFNFKILNELDAIKKDYLPFFFCLNYFI
jgi:hypothetical protein